MVAIGESINHTSHFDKVELFCQKTLDPSYLVSRILQDALIGYVAQLEIRFLSDPVSDLYPHNILQEDPEENQYPPQEENQLVDLSIQDGLS